MPFFPIFSKKFRYLACSCKVSFQSMLIAFQSVKYLHWICEEKVDTSAAQPAPVPFINATTLTYYEEQDATEGFVLFRHHAVISWVIFTWTIFKLIFCWKDPWGINFSTALMSYSRKDWFLAPPQKWTCVGVGAILHGPPSLT